VSPSRDDLAQLAGRLGARARELAAARYRTGAGSAGPGPAPGAESGDLTIADIPMTFEASEMKGRVGYDQDGMVTGLFMLRPDEI
jgi:hypothetical protein